MAAENGHLEVVKLLLQDNRVDPSANNNYGNIVLYLIILIIFFIAIQYAA